MAFDGIVTAGTDVAVITIGKVCDELGLTIVGTHLGLDDFEKEIVYHHYYNIVDII